MIREHWREAGFWRWWWQTQAPREAKAVGALLFVVLVLGGGYVAADRLARANAAVSQMTRSRSRRRCRSS